ncbi:MAG: hypothetical protein MUE54_13390, partial [Anaerolineae bacterium]|nr:hypothetical protein [Anaerolineae bacterium]
MTPLSLFLRPSDWTRLWQSGDWRVHLSLFITPLLGLIPVWVIFIIRAGYGNYNPTPVNDLLPPFLLMSLMFWLVSIPLTLFHPMLATLFVTTFGSVLTLFTPFPFGNLASVSQGLFIGTLILVGLGGTAKAPSNWVIIGRGTMALRLSAAMPMPSSTSRSAPPPCAA